MDIIKLIIGKLDYNLTREEEVCFKNWVDESLINTYMFDRLEALKERGKDLSEIMNLDVEFAWKQVKQKLE
ncbi:hypothetical protein Q4Q34_18265 [Flavivirga abyssicola]|uniref:hypothetical protein n=1 Tax=Flavivirga abyssicola TaxID=3063533 RepID=UPI0026E07177|nr:hypothetical protein [Flavivirga sp. MEBiC07777]WVK13165.1 hypothetical protein Q4Q34_18265 [Flavivirga sp. MEBiC07777]